MKKTFRLIVVAQFIGLFCLINQATTYAGGPGTTTASFLKIGIGAKNIAMGETGATTDDVNSIYWNPSGLNYVSSKEISLMHAIWFEDISYEYLAYCQPTEIGTFGVGLNYLYMTAIEKYDENDNLLTGTYKPSDMAATLSYARKLDLGHRTFNLGLNLKYISSNLDDEVGTAFAFDVGGIYDKLKIKKEKLKIGLAVQNIGTKMKFIDEADPLPLNIKLGCSYNLMPLISQSPNLLISVLDINKPIDNDVRINFGTEYSRKFGKDISLAARVGYKTNTKGYEAIDGLSAGFGFSFKDYALDYAFTPYGDLGDTHRVSVIAKFGGSVAVRLPSHDVEKVDKPAEIPPAPVKTVKPSLPTKKMENYIAGKITRGKNKPVFEAVVKITQKNNELARVYTDDNGKYQTALLPAGKYTVKVWKDGYIAEEAEVEVKEDQPVKADFQLKRELKK